MATVSSKNTGAIVYDENPVFAKVVLGPNPPSSMKLVITP
jgi:hypothetical protein